MPNFELTAIDGKLTQIAVGNAQQIWGVNANDQIYRRTGAGWTQMPGAAVNVSAAADGTAWVVNRAGNIYQWTGADWRQVSGSLTQVSVGSANLVWGVNANDQIFRWLGGDSWEQITGAAVNVSVAADGAVWIVSRNGNIYQWTGAGWRQVSGSLKQVSVGSASAVWSVNANAQVYRWLGGDSWEQITGSLKWVSVGNDGTVMGATPDNTPVALTPQSSPAPAPLPMVMVAATSRTAADRRMVFYNNTDRIINVMVFDNGDGYKHVGLSGIPKSDKALQIGMSPRSYSWWDNPDKDFVQVVYAHENPSVLQGYLVTDAPTSGMDAWVYLGGSLNNWDFRVGRGNKYRVVDMGVPISPTWVDAENHKVHTGSGGGLPDAWPLNAGSPALSQPPSTAITLCVSNGMYVCAVGGGGSEIVANRTAAGLWETFGLIALGNDWVALQASNGMYLCAEGGGGREVVANRTTIGEWERFKLINPEGRKISLQAANGMYVCAEGGGGRELVANRTVITPWEQFARWV